MSLKTIIVGIGSSLVVGLILWLLVDSCSFLNPCEPEIRITNYERVAKILSGERAKFDFKVNNEGKALAIDCHIIMIKLDFELVELGKSSQSFSLPAKDSYETTFETFPLKGHGGVGAWAMVQCENGKSIDDPLLRIYIYENKTEMEMVEELFGQEFRDFRETVVIEP